MNRLFLGIALTIVIAVELASAGDVLYLPSRSSSKGTWVTILGPDTALVDYLRSEQHPPAIGERIEELFKVAKKDSSPSLPGWPGLSDSFIIEISTGQFRLVRIDYWFDDFAPRQGRMWIASLRRPVDNAPLFQMSEYASVPIPEDLSRQLEAVRQSEIAVTERRHQMAESLRNSEEAIQRSRDAETLMREMVITTRRYGTCCPGAEPGSPAAEARATELEREADKLSSKIQEAVQELDKRRAVVLLHLNERAPIGNGEPAAPSDGDKPSN